MALDIEAWRDVWLGHEAEKLKEKRRYSHFDPIVALDADRKSLLFDPNAVKGHSFFPLILSVKEERRRKRNEETGNRDVFKKERDIRYAAHIDALIYSWYGYQLNELYSTMLERLGINDEVLAYRAMDKSTPDHVREVGDFIMTSGNCVTLCFDIKDFFGAVPHAELKANWQRVLGLVDAPNGRLPEDHFVIFKNVTGYRSVEIETLQKLFPKNKIPSSNGRYLPKGSFIDFVVEKNREMKVAGKTPLLLKNSQSFGIPQGLPISGVLANIAMLDFDVEMKALATAHHGIYRRYSDDILLAVAPESAVEVEKGLRAALARLKLKPNEKKREVRVFSRVGDGKIVSQNDAGTPAHLQYLGIEFNGESYFLRSQSVSRFYGNLNRRIGRAAVSLKKKGGKVLRYRDLYRRFTSLGARDNTRNFVSYAREAHRILAPYSKIDKQISDTRIKKAIKAGVAKRR